jgi:hypothetical protein
MRRTFALAFITAALLAAFAWTGPTSSAQPEPSSALNITKVVDGDGPTGGYVIEYFCTEENDGAPSEGGGSGGSLAFDAAGPGSPETQSIEITETSTCTVTETGTNGADTVTYACDFDQIAAGPAAGGFATEGDAVAGCIDDQSGVIDGPFQTLTITVTNTFEPEVLPDDTEPPPVVNPDVVAATPSFTG